MYGGSKYFFPVVWTLMCVNLYSDISHSDDPNSVSKYFCKNISDTCNCSQLPSTSIVKIECREWSPEFFTVDYNNWNSSKPENVWINGRNTTIPLAFLKRLPYLVGDRYSVKISNFCNNPAKINNHLNLSEIFENLISSFKKQGYVIILKMPNNCLTSITGSLGKHYSSYVSELNFRFNKLTQIPTFPHSFDSLITFDVSNNNVGTVSNNDFNNTLNLEQLNLSNNNLTSLPDNLLLNLKNLDELDLSYNRISVLPERFLQENPKLRKFNIANNMLTLFPQDFFENSRTIENINLSHNRFTRIFINFKLQLKSLKVLRLESNNIKSISFLNIEHCKDLKELILTNNQIHYIFRVHNSRYNLDLNFDISNNKMWELHFPLTSYINNAGTFDMSNNCFAKYSFLRHFISRIDQEIITNFKCSNCCLDSIKTGMFSYISSKIDIPFNKINELDENSLKEFRRITHVNLSHNRISHVDLTLFQINYQNHTELVHFDLSYNPFECDCKLNKFIKYLRNPNQIKSFIFKTENNFCSEPIEMRGTSLITIDKKLFCEYPQNCPLPCHCYVDDLDDITFVLIVCSDSSLTSFPSIPNYNSSVAIHLNLSRNQISSLPEQNNPVWSKVTILDLSYNQLKSLENMPVTPKLTILYLNNNFLTAIDDQIESLSHLSEIKLANNPWKCNCKMSKFLINSSFFHEKSVLTCEKDNSIYYFTDIDHICNNLHLLWLLLPIILIVIIISAIVVLFNNYKSEILYYMFAKGICLRFVCEEDVDADKVYDAFVSYSSEDEDWIADFLVPGLESGIPSYKLCLHNRDWPAGEFITDQIVRSVGNSRRTILVLTDNYFKSGWSRLEFDIAYQQGLKDKVNRLIAVVPNEVPDLSKIDQDFKTFITLTTYVEAKKPYFWRKLRASMPRTKNIRAPSTKRESIHLNAAFYEN
uniref:TIR domain-containing protein n=1 Tax=Strigamia maritima TaxID=126957 RepID=T1JEM9_STRMM